MVDEAIPGQRVFAREISGKKAAAAGLMENVILASLLLYQSTIVRID